MAGKYTNVGIAIANQHSFPVFFMYIPSLKSSCENSNMPLTGLMIAIIEFNDSGSGIASAYTLINFIPIR